MTQTVPDAARELRAQGGIEAAARSESGVTSLRAASYVAPMVVYLMTDQAWDVNGHTFNVSGGQVGLSHEIQPLRQISKPGRWTFEELRDLVPAQLMGGLRNPAPPPPDLDLPGRPVAAS